MEVLSDLVQYISCDVTEQLTGSTKGGEHIFKLRLESAETRYNRMKALVCASLEKQARLQQECEELRLSTMAESIGVSASDSVTMMQNMLNELKAVRDENSRLIEMNRCLRHSTPVVLQSMDAKDNKAAVEGDLRVARQQISALELELVRTADQQFEMEERLREYEDVFDRLLGREHVAIDPVHPRFHPISTCLSPACQSYANRLRNGLRREMADAYVRDRNVRINGYFQRVVRPLEALRDEKDQRIDELLSRIARLVCATVRSADDVDEEMVRVVYGIEKLKSDAEALGEEIKTLENTRLSLVSELGGLQQEIQEASGALDELTETRGLCRAEMHCLDEERKRVEAEWERVQCFLNGQMGVEYDRMLKDYQMLQRKLKAAQQEDVRNDETADAMQQDDAPVKRIGKTIFIACRCGVSVPVDDIGSHIIKIHGAKEGEKIFPCPEGCGFFADTGKEMVEHVRGSECGERLSVIKRLRESAKCV